MTSTEAGNLMFLATIPVLDVLAWGILAVFALSILSRSTSPTLSRTAAIAGWSSFAVFWLAQTPVFFLEQHSYIEALLSILATIVSTRLALQSLDTPPTALYTCMTAITAMGILFLPFETIPWTKRTLIELVTLQTLWGVKLLGYAPELVVGPSGKYRNALLFSHPSAGLLRTHIEFACTGLGSIAIVSGLISVTKESLPNKLAGLAVVVPVIWVLNWVRNIFIAAAFGDQWFQVGVDYVLPVSGFSEPELVSFFIADKVISQSLSVVALLSIIYALFRFYPSLDSLLKNVLRLAVGERLYERLSPN